ncbi:O-antigen/teichoic acid export membrane protein [Wenyingzhuangia heitensis]|uniref:O-antigen/teichoic acid export membrane protein n=1 Tax=Wenyingzhuangia heitensis TaxID=1487859 RepID=A0ABX0U633_9FLAO|nr:lipopolysaccharide biosynthesis protein [Wenyingzhuangia heitensis]NIJ44308.1 O-antigen/teichoic acid export membrane protein [Wenyingzhuangia heitensis]
MSVKIAFLWSAVGKVGQFIITFISSVLIARILSPNDYGLIGVLTVFTVISTLLIDSGFKDVLILNAKKNTELEYSTVFFVNASMSLCLYVCLFFLAPHIANYFDSQLLKPLSRILFISLIINGFTIVPLTILTLNLNFKLISLVEVVSIVLSSLLGLLMAYNDYGVWALVYPLLISSLCRTIGFWLFAKWVPTFQFDFVFFMDKIKFCSKLILIRLMTAISTNFIPVIVGKIYNLREVGFFNRANNLQTMPNNIIVATINEVSYPMLSKLELDLRVQKFKEILKLSSMITFPITVALMMMAKPLIIVLLTDKWSDSIPMLEVLSLLIAISLLSFINNSMIKIQGNINTLFWISLLKNIGTIILLILFKDYGIMTLCYVYVGVSYGVHIYYMYVSSKITNYTLANQLTDLLPSLLAAICMGGVMCFIKIMNINSYLVLLIMQSILGFVFLLGVYWFFFKKEKEMFISMIKNR